MEITTAVLTACKHSDDDEPEQATDSDRIVEADEMIVLETDSTEWHVRLFATGLIYSEAMKVSLQSPWRLPTREEAKVMKDLSYPNSERFITSDGYTFGMPSASVTKAGTKTKYSVLGLYIRKSAIVVEF